ncbi:MAG TPA: RNA polymerase sigma factor [Chitinophagaceae bacterium]
MPAENNLIDELIAGCLIGKRSAQEQLYERFYRAMAAICMRYTKNREDAVEVLNDGFVKVFKNIQRFDRVKASLYTWMRTIMINTAIDFIKRQQPAFTDLNLPEEEEPAIENDIILKTDADELLGLIRRLPAATQTVFTLFTVDGYSHQEIGQLLGISEGTSKWHVSDARKKLKQFIRHHE